MANITKEYIYRKTKENDVFFFKNIDFVQKFKVERFTIRYSASCIVYLKIFHVNRYFYELSPFY